MMQRVVLSASVLCFLAGSAGAQVTVLAQERKLEGVSISTYQDGSTFTDGPYVIAPPSDYYYYWADQLQLSGNMTANAMQQGGFDGVGTFQLDLWSMSISGGGDVNTSGTATLVNKFSYLFEVTEPCSYTLDTFFGGSLPIVTSFEFRTGSTVLLADDNTDNQVVEFHASGILQPGTYSFTVDGSGTISYTGPGGNGGGAGGQQPLFRLAITPLPPCGSADFDGDGDVGTDADIEAFFACLAGICCPTCYPGGADFDGDGDVGTDADIESFFRVLAGGAC
jgi:hypothetical protein